MAFSLNEDQTLLKDAADGFFADNSPVASFRKLRDAKETLDPTIWGEIGAMGFSGALIDEQHGGSGMGLRAMGLVLEAQARTLGVSPLFQTGLMGATMLKLQGTAAQQDELLPKIADGSHSFALALDEGPHHAPHTISTKASKTASGWSLSGKKRFVPDGTHAQTLIVIAQTDAGLGAFLVPEGTPGMTRQALSTVDSRDLADVTFDTVALDAAA